ncbi:unnamed protein product [Amoebophrya sp. A120]|nr:unnamed protein product [Amoebophrya sp. A120]|eukprot:GSA120T00008007001.1
MTSEYLIDIDVHSLYGIRPPLDEKGDPRSTAFLNPYVVVNSLPHLQEERKTDVRREASSCMFNAYFALLGRLSPLEFQEEVIQFTVMNELSFIDKAVNLTTSDELVGTFVVEINKVWATEHKKLEKQWFPVLNPERLDQRGWINLSVRVFTAKDAIPSRAVVRKRGKVGGRGAGTSTTSSGDSFSAAGAGDDSSSSSATSNSKSAQQLRDINTRISRMPSEARVQIAQLKILIHRCQKLFTPFQTVECNPFVECALAGFPKTITTSVKENTVSPVYGEQLCFPFVLSPWNTTVRLRICTDNGLFGDNACLNKISFDVTPVLESGAVPPVYLSLFSYPVDCLEYAKKSESYKQKLLEFSDIYQCIWGGRILVSAVREPIFENASTTSTSPGSSYNSCAFFGKKVLPAHELTAVGLKKQMLRVSLYQLDFLMKDNSHNSDLYFTGGHDLPSEDLEIVFEFHIGTRVVCWPSYYAAEEESENNLNYDDEDKSFVTITSLPPFQRKKNLTSITFDEATGSVPGFVVEKDVNTPLYVLVRFLKPPEQAVKSHHHGNEHRGGHHSKNHASTTSDEGATDKLAAQHHDHDEIRADQLTCALCGQAPEAHKLSSSTHGDSPMPTWMDFYSVQNVGEIGARALIAVSVEEHVVTAKISKNVMNNYRGGAAVGSKDRKSSSTDRSSPTAGGSVSPTAAPSPSVVEKTKHVYHAVDWEIYVLRVFLFQGFHFPERDRGAVGPRKRRSSSMSSQRCIRISFGTEVRQVAPATSGAATSGKRHQAEDEMNNEATTDGSRNFKTTELEVAHHESQHPVWNEVVELQTKLPTDRSLWPYVRLDVVDVPVSRASQGSRDRGHHHHDTGTSSGTSSTHEQKILARGRIPGESLPIQYRGMPFWMNLRRNSSHYQGEVHQLAEVPCRMLLALECFPFNSFSLPKQITSAVPAAGGPAQELQLTVPQWNKQVDKVSTGYFPCDVRLFVLGVRLFTEVGKSAESRSSVGSRRTRLKGTSAGSAGSSQEVHFSSALATTTPACPYLEICDSDNNVVARSTVCKDGSNGGFNFNNEFKFSLNLSRKRAVQDFLSLTLRDAKPMLSSKRPGEVPVPEALVAYDSENKNNRRSKKQESPELKRRRVVTAPGHRTSSTTMGSKNFTSLVREQGRQSQVVEEGAMVLEGRSDDNVADGAVVHTNEYEGETRREDRPNVPSTGAPPRPQSKARASVAGSDKGDIDKKNGDEGVEETNVQQEQERELADVVVDDVDVDPARRPGAQAQLDAQQGEQQSAPPAPLRYPSPRDVAGCHEQSTTTFGKLFAEQFQQHQQNRGDHGVDLDLSLDWSFDFADSSALDESMSSPTRQKLFHQQMKARRADADWAGAVGSNTTNAYDEGGNSVHYITGRPHTAIGINPLVFYPEGEHFASPAEGNAKNSASGGGFFDNFTNRLSEVGTSFGNLVAGSPDQGEQSVSSGGKKTQNVGKADENRDDSGSASFGFSVSHAADILNSIVGGGDVPESGTKKSVHHHSHRASRKGKNDGEHDPSTTSKDHHRSRRAHVTSDKRAAAGRGSTSSTSTSHHHHHHGADSSSSRPAHIESDEELKFGKKLCSGHIHLNPHCPWFSAETRKRLRTTFSTVREDDNGHNADEADFSSSSEEETDNLLGFGRNEGSFYWKRVVAGGRESNMIKGQNEAPGSLENDAEDVEISDREKFCVLMKEFAEGADANPNPFGNNTAEEDHAGDDLFRTSKHKSMKAGSYNDPSSRVITVVEADDAGAAGDSTGKDSFFLEEDEYRARMLRSSFTRGTEATDVEDEKGINSVEHDGEKNAQTTAPGARKRRKSSTDQMTTSVDKSVKRRRRSSFAEEALSKAILLPSKKLLNTAKRAVLPQAFRQTRRKKKREAILKADKTVNGFKEEFEWKPVEAHEDFLVPSKLEQTLEPDGWLYEKAELFVVNDFGETIVAGVVKYCLCVLPKFKKDSTAGRRSSGSSAVEQKPVEEIQEPPVGTTGGARTSTVVDASPSVLVSGDSSEDHPSTGFLNRTNNLFNLRVNQLKKEMQMARNLLIRIYVQQGDLLPYGGKNLQTSLQLVGDHSGLQNVGGDRPEDHSNNHFASTSETLTMHTPEYRKAFTLTDCSFPRNALVRVTVLEHTEGDSAGGDNGGGSSTGTSIGNNHNSIELGSTFIDLEDRFFHSRNRQSMRLRRTALESRPLHPVGYSSRGISTGRLILRAEVLAESDAGVAELLAAASVEQISASAGGSSGAGTNAKSLADQIEEQANSVKNAASGLFASVRNSLPTSLTGGGAGAAERAASNSNQGGEQAATENPDGNNTSSSSGAAGGTSALTNETMLKKNGERVQIRLAIFDVTDILFGEGVEGQDSYLNLSVTAKLTLDDGNTYEQQTDVHRRVAPGGRAVFNWRLCFDVVLPLQNPTLTLTAFVNNLVFANEPLGETLIDLSQDLDEAREVLLEQRQNSEKQRLKLLFAKSPVFLYLPAYPGKVRAVVNTELQICGFNEQKVGRGREKPNINPFLDPEDKELQAGRQSMFTNNAFVNTVVAVARGAWTAAKWILILKISIAVIGFVYATIITMNQAGLINRGG